ncbi:hypothetical protein BU17DRAFT_88940 [Hysterangium stoloniferum]|nr:hypothetical protein BU17DRAFT_88940 [Hysterangium stoloniferum]
MSVVLEATPSVFLLIPGFLPLFFFIQSRLIIPSAPPKRAPVICIFVSLLGPLATISAALAIVIPAIDRYKVSLNIAQVILQGFIELGYRCSILYMVNPPSFVITASRVNLSTWRIRCHNIVFAAAVIATLCFAPLSRPMTSRLCLADFSPASSDHPPTTPKRVRYEAPEMNQRRQSNAVISEDFTALRDPFASPTHRKPKTPPHRLQVTPPSTPRSFLDTSSPFQISPTPPCKVHLTPRARIMDRKHLQRTSTPSSAGGVGRKVSSQSFQPLADEADKNCENLRCSDDVLFLNDEALLSQVLLHSLTMEASPPASIPAAPVSDMPSLAAPDQGLPGCDRSLGLPSGPVSVAEPHRMLHRNSSNTATAGDTSPLMIHNSHVERSQRRTTAQYHASPADPNLLNTNAAGGINSNIASSQEHFNSNVTPWIGQVAGLVIENSRDKPEACEEHVRVKMNGAKNGKNPNAWWKKM